jgi:hypothetical protein
LSKPSQSTPRRSRHVFFVDENLGKAKLPGHLRAAGYNVITHFERYGEIDGIEDPKIIADCGVHKTVLLTADGDMETTWAAEIAEAGIYLVILTNNSDGADKWGERLAKGRKAIVNKLREYRKPCAIIFGRDSRVCKVRLYGKRRDKSIRF